jgi:putative ABC transport system permease protein
VAEAVSQGNRSDLILGPSGLGMGISPAVADLVRDRPEVQTVVTFRETVGLVQGEEGLVSAVETDGLEQVIDLGIEAGDLSALGPGTILVDDDAAADHDLAVGDRLTVTFADSGPIDLEVAGTFSQGSLINATYVMSMPDFVANVTLQKLDAAVFVTFADGVDPGEGKRAIEDAVAEYPNVDVNDPADLTAEAQASVDQLLGIVTALLLLAVVVAILGILNTLVLSVVERTREIGVLRAVGATRRQVRAVVRRESVLMALLGALTGVGLGIVAGIALSRALEGEGITTVAVPGVQIVIYLVIAALVGVLAAVGPARRASKVNVLQAIATE